MRATDVWFTMKKNTLCFVLSATLSACAAADNADLDALQLADQAPTATPAAAGDKRFFVEGALGAYDARAGDETKTTGRLSAGLNVDSDVAPHWRAVLADRFDSIARADFSGRDSVNTLQEAYLSWQPDSENAVDVGRINIRHGVATGYNPTDYFREDAIRAVVSLDPGALRNNRLGTVALRGQRVWTSGSLTALYSPRLENEADTGVLSPDLGATNNRDRWLLVLSQRIAGSFAPQWLLYGGAGQSPQLGVNATELLGDATVIFLEWSGGRGDAQIERALNRAEDDTFRQRASAGFTYTAATKLTLSLEYEYDGAALDRDDWKTLRTTSPQAVGQYLLWTRGKQELTTRHAWFAYAMWQDALVNDLDLTALQRFNPEDDSGLFWLEARYHLERADLALQWQINNGDTLTTYGAAAQRQSWQMVATLFF